MMVAALPAAVTVGVDAFTPNSSASLLVDEWYVGSAEEERFQGAKRAAVWPATAIQSLLKAAELSEQSVTSVVLNFDPVASRTRPSLTIPVSRPRLSGGVSKRSLPRGRG